MTVRCLLLMLMCTYLTACAEPRDAPILIESPGRSGVVMPIENPSLQQGADRAMADLAQRLSVPKAEIRLVSARSVDWPSSALGCPQPDRMYATVLTPGYEIVLETRGKQYHYHAGRQGEPFLCPSERREPPAATESERL
ncbi:MAG TPA: hypothetical protein VLT59_09870 [Steroidobacteraceae bacterium]|nr:hypothetical protein [Steroidobacteraceae bacterium]